MNPKRPNIASNISATTKQESIDAGRTAARKFAGRRDKLPSGSQRSRQLLLAASFWTSSNLRRSSIELLVRFAAGYRTRAIPEDVIISSFLGPLPLPHPPHPPPFRSLSLGSAGIIAENPGEIIRPRNHIARKNLTRPISVSTGTRFPRPAAPPPAPRRAPCSRGKNVAHYAEETAPPAELFNIFFLFSVCPGISIAPELRIHLTQVFTVIKLVIIHLTRAQRNWVRNNRTETAPRASRFINFQRKGY